MTNEEKILQLERGNRELQDRIAKMDQDFQFLIGIFRGSSDTRLALHNTIASDPESFLGLFGATPVVQQAAIVDVTGGATIDSQARTAVNSILSTLRNYGIIKP
jgi:hypothetical protein